MADMMDYCISCGRDADGKNGIQCKNCDAIDEKYNKNQNDPSLVEMWLKREDGSRKLKFFKRENFE
jgi:hypothetical protein